MPHVTPALPVYGRYFKPSRASGTADDLPVEVVGCCVAEIFWPDVARHGRDDGAQGIDPEPGNDKAVLIGETT